MSLHLKLFGNYEARLNGELIRFPTERARMLLAYLAMHPCQPQTRKILSDYFWPDKGEDAARNSLRTELSRLRHVIGEKADNNSILLATRLHIEFAPSAAVSVDVHQFQTLLAAVRAHQHPGLSQCDPCMANLRQAASLHRGIFLADVSVPESEEVERWLQNTRETLLSELQWALDALVHYHQEQGDPDEVIRLARYQIELQPWHETAHQQLMRALTLTGQRTAALRQFEMAERILSAELAAKPSAESMALYQQISADALPSVTAPLENPYQGLQAFRTNSAGFFFGRESVTDRLFEAVHSHAFAALIGPSGSGKSSVVHAGLLPRLLRRPCAAPGLIFTPLDEDDRLQPNLLGVTLAHPAQISQRPPQQIEWSVVSFRPSEDPFHALSEAIVPLLPSRQRDRPWAQILRQDAQGWRDFIAQLEPPHHPSTDEDHLDNGTAAHEDGVGVQQRLLLVIDQFEELFTLCADPETRRQFFELLQNAIEQTSTTMSVCTLIALRADFMAQALVNSQLTDALQGATLVLGPMQRTELRRAIEQPALRQGVVFEPGLVDRLLDDVGGEPGNLPLLEFALTLLWQEQQDGWLTHEAYDELEHVVGALTHYANGVYARLEPAEQSRAQHIFLQLVQAGQGTEDTRRTATRIEIGEADWRLVQRLADTRLVVTNRNAKGDETVELVHEALIREWSLLKNWLEADREFRLWQQRVRVSLSQWQQTEQDTGTLLRGAPLAEAEHWLQIRIDDLSDPLRDYIQASITHRQHNLSLQQERQRREFEQVQALALAESQRAETEARTGRRMRRLAVGAAFAFLIAFVAAAYAFQSQQLVTTERNHAQKSAQLALARQLSAQAIRGVDKQIDLALLLGLASTQVGLPQPDEAELLTELAVPPMLTTVLQKTDAPVFDLVFSPDGKSLFSRDEGSNVFVWDLTDTRAAPVPLIADDSTIRESMFSLQGDLMAVNREQSVEIWDLTTRTPLTTLTDHEDDVVSVGFSQDGRYLITSDTKTMLVRDARSGEVVKAPIAVPFDVAPINSPDGELFGRALVAEFLPEVTDENLQYVAMWTPETGDIVYDPDHGHDSNIHSFHFSPDQSKLATASFDGTVILWDVKTGLQIGDPLRGHDGRVLIARFSPDGKLLVTAGVDGQIILWDLQAEPTMAMRLNTHNNWIRAVSFSPDGNWFATGDIDGKILLWHIADRRVLSGHTDRVRTVNVSPDGQTMVSASFDHRLGVWDASSGQLRQMLATEHVNAIINAQFSPDGESLVSVDAGGTVIFWDTQSWQPRKVAVRAHEDVVIAIAFSQNGRRLATGDFGGTIRLWDVATGTQVGAPIAAHKWWALSLAFSPDGATLASGGTDTNIKLWDVATQTQIGETLEGHTNWITDLIFTQDGTKLISSSADQTIRVWDVASGQPDGEPLIGHRAQVWTVKFSPAGTNRFLVSADEFGKVIRWDWQTRQPLGPPLATHVKTESMDISPDGNYVYLGTFDTNAYRWSLSWQPWSETACTLANRSMSAEESERYLHETAFASPCLPAMD